jgi:hypothetical protein
MEINGRGDSLRWRRDILYPLKLALTSPTSGGRSVGIVRLRTKVTEFYCAVISPTLHRQVVEWSANNELGRIRLYHKRGINRYLCRSTEENHENLPTEIRTEHLPNKSLHLPCYINLLDKKIYLFHATSDRNPSHTQLRIERDTWRSWNGETEMSGRQGAMRPCKRSKT